jgi:hypothetical protein
MGYGSTQCLNTHAAMQHLADYLSASGLTCAHGGVIEHRASNDNEYLRLGFGTPTNLDGEVNAYSPTWVLVWFASSTVLRGEHRVKCKSVAEAQRFIRFAFVEHNEEGAIAIYEEAMNREGAKRYAKRGRNSRGPVSPA